MSTRQNRLITKLDIVKSEIINFFLVPLSYYCNKALSKPILAGFFLTNKCNSRCNMCSYWKLAKEQVNEITFVQAKKMLKEVKSFGVKYLSFSAEGEIFTNRDSLKILNLAKKMGFPFSINSNSLAIDKYLAKEIATLSPYSLIIGLDTIDNEKYFKIRGIPNGVDKVKKAIEYLHKEDFYNISIGAVIMKENLDNLVDLVNFAVKNKIKSIRFTAFQQIGFGKSFDEVTYREYSSPEFLERVKYVVNQLIDLKRRFKIISNSYTYLRMIPAFFSSKKFIPVNCMQGYLSFNIYPNGDVLLCQIMGKTSKVGNILDKSLKEIWHSNASKKVRTIIKNKQCPGCWLSCYAEENLRFSVKYGFEPNFNKLLRGISL